MLFVKSPLWGNYKVSKLYFMILEQKYRTGQCFRALKSELHPHSLNFTFSLQAS